MACAVNSRPESNRLRSPPVFTSTLTCDPPTSTASTLGLVGAGGTWQWCQARVESVEAFVPLDVETTVGTARVHLGAVGAVGGARGALVLGHGAGGGVSSRDLVTAAEVGSEEGFAPVLVEQPYRDRKS